MSQSCLALHIFLIKEKQKEIIPAGRTNTCPWVSMHLGGGGGRFSMYLERGCGRFSMHLWCQSLVFDAPEGSTTP